MQSYFQLRYALSKEGAKSLIQGILWSVLYNFSLFLPMCGVAYYISEVLDVYLFHKKTSLTPLPYYLLGSLIALLLIGIILRYQYDSVYTATYTESANLRIQIAERLRKFPLSFFAKHDIADLSASIMSDIESLEHAMSHALPQFYASIISAICIFLGISIMNWKIGLAMAWPLPLVLVMIKIVQNKIQKTNEEHFQSKRAVTQAIQEIIEQILPLKAYAAQTQCKEHFDKLTDDEEKTHLASEMFIPKLLMPLNSLIKLGAVGALLVGLQEYLAGHVDLGFYLMILIASLVVYVPFEAVLSYLLEIIFLKPVISRMKKIRNTSIMGGADIEPENLDIVLEHVSFAYEDGVEVLNDISLQIHPGEVVALVGPSGSGKTTLAKLILRFWDIDQGSIKLGGYDLRELEPEAYLRNFSMVFQDVVLFNNTVLENIRIGRKDASDEEVIAAAKAAQVDEFVEHLPQGYLTEIGENGALLSGGERQRISIARAILKDAPIIILDESTTSIDAENETLIQEALVPLLKGKTVIVIAHRLRTVEEADCIYVFSEGKLLESGQSPELLARGGLYAELYALQEEN